MSFILRAATTTATTNSMKSSSSVRIISKLTSIVRKSNLPSSAQQRTITTSATSAAATSLQSNHFIDSNDNRTINTSIIQSHNTNKHLFSTAVQIDDEDEDDDTPSSPKPQKSRIQKKDAITVTPAAAKRIQTLLSSPNGKDAIGILLGVKRRGCNGLSYTLDYCTEPKKGAEKIESHGVKVFIEPMALFSIVGTEMDWVENDLTSEFTFINPNSKGECGCGESFNVWTFWIWERVWKSVLFLSRDENYRLIIFHLLIRKWENRNTRRRVFEMLDEENKIAKRKKALGFRVEHSLNFEPLMQMQLRIRLMQNLKWTLTIVSYDTLLLFLFFN